MQRVRLTKRVRLEKPRTEDPRWGSMKDHQQDISDAMRQVANLFPRTLERKSSAAIVYGEVTGYSLATARPRYKPGPPEEVILDMLWMIRHHEHMYWTQVMMAGVDALHQLLKEKHDAED